jgi:hypothetical protein
MSLSGGPGVIEDVLDPLKLGRVRVRVLGYHNDDKVMLPTAHLPWSATVQPVSSAAISGVGTSPTGLVPGTWVVGFFRDGSGCQEPVVMGSIAGIPLTKSTPNIGFNDPSGEFPRTDHLNEPDTNRLARNESVEKTIVAVKNQMREVNIEGAIGSDTWSEPESPYNATYPNNAVFQTKSGHVQEFDDTPSHERIHTYHKAGTFEEIHPDGSKVTKVVKTNYEVTLGDNKILIRGRKTENVAGDSNLKVGGNVHIHIQENANILVDGDVVMETKGDFMHKVGGSYGVVAEGNMTLIAPRIDFNPEESTPSIGSMF